MKRALFNAARYRACASLFNAARYRACASLVLTIAIVLSLSISSFAQNSALRIYWIDAEGGAATLFVAPSGESMLFDTGFGVGGRDAKRIYATAQKAGLKQIDHVVISHWHEDHEGGLAALSKMISIGHFYDHGNGVEDVDRVRLEDYKRVAGAKRTIVKPGDTIPLRGVQVQVVSSEGPVIANAINGGGPNSLCANAAQMGPAGPENQRMVGLLIS